MMELIIQAILNDYLLLTLALVGFAIFLRSWNPPIAKQYQFIILQIISALLVVALEGIKINMVHFCYGFIITNLVFYGKEYIDAVKLIKDHEKVNHDIHLEDRIKYWELKEDEPEGK